MIFRVFFKVKKVSFLSLGFLYYFLVMKIKFILLFVGYFKAMKIVYGMKPAEKPDYAGLKKLLKQYKTELK